MEATLVVQNSDGGKSSERTPAETDARAVHRNKRSNWDRILARAVGIARIKFGERQSIETLANEEALLFAQYLRDERKTWIPRVDLAQQKIMSNTTIQKRA